MMEMLVQILSLAVMTAVIVCMYLQRKPKKRRNGEPPLIVDVELAEEDVTPTLIQELMACNLAMKRRLIAVAETGNTDECEELQRRIMQNNQFIIDLFQYDGKLKDMMNSNQDMEHKKADNDNIPELKKVIGRQQRLDV